MFFITKISSSDGGTINDDMNKYHKIIGIYIYGEYNPNTKQNKHQFSTWKRNYYLLSLKCLMVYFDKGIV